MKMAKSLNSSGHVSNYMDSKFGAFAFLGAVILIVGLIFASAQITSAATPIGDEQGSDIGIGTQVGCGVIVSQFTGKAVSGCAGTLPPGTACTSDSQCSLGSCDCGKGGVTGKVCCSRDTGHACQGNDECATKVCNNGVCANTPAGNPKLSNGDKCRTNEECTSGKCEIRSTAHPYYVCKP